MFLGYGKSLIDQRADQETFPDHSHFACATLRTRYDPKKCPAHLCGAAFIDPFLEK